MLKILPLGLVVAIILSHFSLLHPTSVMGQSGDTCSFSSAPQIQDGNLLFSISGTGEYPAVHIRASEDPTFANFPVFLDPYGEYEDLGDGQYRIDYSIPMSELSDTFGEDSLGLQSIYTTLDGSSYTACGSAPRLSDAAPGDSPDDEPPPEPTLPPDSLAAEKYEAARVATEEARANAACAESASNEAMRSLRLADPETAAAEFAEAEQCASALNDNLATIQDAQNYWASLENEYPLTDEMTAQMDDIDRWTGEVEGLNDSVDPIYDEAKNLMDACGDVGHTIVCSRDPDNYDEDAADEAAENSSGGGATLENNACFNDRIDETIYNSPSCQSQRETRAETAKDQQARRECEQRKSEGAVWVVFADQCVTFEEFGGIAIQYILIFSSIIAGVMFVVASFKYLASRGDPSALADARDMMVNAAVGMVLIATAFGIVQLLNGTFGFAGDAINLLPFFEFNPI